LYLNAVAGKVDCRRIIRRELVEEFLPLGVERSAPYVFGAHHLEAKRCKGRRNSAGIIDGPLQLLLWAQMVVFVDANDEGNLALGESRTCCDPPNEYRRQNLDSDAQHPNCPSAPPKRPTCSLARPCVGHLIQASLQVVSAATLIRSGADRTCSIPPRSESKLC